MNTRVSSLKEDGALLRTALSPAQATLKRGFDLALAMVLLALTGWIIPMAWVVASLSTRSNGFFRQVRIGKEGHPFKVIKIKTMRQVPGVTTTATSAVDPRITPAGRWMRRAKIDELPQLFNVLVGDMSFVGPRPDVPGFADQLQGEDRIILSVRPGITGPATLHFRREEELLSQQGDPERYNQEVIYPMKIRLNKEYISQYSFYKDLGYIVLTLLGR